jgi:hypothetical protein
MLSFIAIDPRNATVEVVEAEELTQVYERVGLERAKVDHSSIARLPNDELICIVVDDLGMYKPASEAKYWSIGAQLLEGGAVIYAADALGETVSIKHKPPVTFYRDAGEVERAIASGEVMRPQMLVNGEVVWSWPHKRRPF